VFYCGVDLTKDVPSNFLVERERLGVPLDATAIGCIANFNLAKNHAFLLEVFARILRYDAKAHLILVGDGPKKAAIERQAVKLGVTERVHLLGRRKDVPALLSTFNAFVLPSLTEGLPIALLESQAQGIPCLTSTAVTREVEVIPGLVKFLSLSADPDEWARTAIVMAQAGQKSNQNRSAFEHSPYNIDRGVSRLAQVYLSQ
jgi:glycosyltransferase involved in cell wall biosynthesis